MWILFGNQNKTWFNKVWCRIPGIYTISCAILLLFGRSPDYVSTPIVESITPIVGTIFLNLIFILLDSDTTSQSKLISLLVIIIILLILFWPVWQGIILLRHD